MSWFYNKLNETCLAKEGCRQTVDNLTSTTDIIIEDTFAKVVDSQMWEPIIGRLADAFALMNDKYVISLSDLDPTLTMQNFTRLMQPYAESGCFDNEDVPMGMLRSKLKPAIAEALERIGLAPGDYEVSRDLKVTIFIRSICDKLATAK